jgi:MFS transporter, DHA1 family, multidrug resistance protein
MTADGPHPLSVDSPRIRLTASGSWIALLTALAAVGQFASNIYTPALPAIALDLRVGEGAVQLTLAVFLAGFAVAQLAWGPLSDRFGRRPAVLGGLVLFALGSAICAVSADLPTLLAGRAIQAVGAGAGIVVSRAVTRDSFDGDDLARVLALVSIAFALVPGLTPLIGGIVTDGLGWRSTFWLTLALGVVLAAVVLLRLPETNAGPAARLDPRAVAAAYAEVLSAPAFLAFAVPVSLVFGAMSAFFAGAPVLFVSHLGVSPSEFGLYPPLAVSGFILGGLATRRLIGGRPPAAIVGIGLALLVFGAAAMTLLPMLGIVHKHAYNATMVLHVTGLGIFMPVAIAEAMRPFRERAGTAAAALGFLQMAAGAGATVAVAGFAERAPELSFPVAMLALDLAALAAFALSKMPASSGGRDRPA